MKHNRYSHTALETLKTVQSSKVMDNKHGLLVNPSEYSRSTKVFDSARNLATIFGLLEAQKLLKIFSHSFRRSIQSDVK